MKLSIPIERFTSPPEDSLPLLHLYFRSLVTGTLKLRWCPVLYVVALSHVNSFIFSQDAAAQVCCTKDCAESDEKCVYVFQHWGSFPDILKELPKGFKSKSQPVLIMLVFMLILCGFYISHSWTSGKHVKFFSTSRRCCQKVFSLNLWKKQCLFFRIQTHIFCAK